MVVVVDTVSATPLRQLADGVDLATFFAICGAACLSRSALLSHGTGNKAEIAPTIFRARAV